MKAFPLMLLLAIQALGAVDGTVINRTSDAPQPGAAVTLVQPGQSGMQTLASTKADASGKFRFEQDVAGPVLIQVLHQGVTYSHILPPGTPTANIQVEVFDVTKNPGTARMTQHMVLFQTTENALEVTDSFLYENRSKTSFNDPVNGSTRIYVPAAAKDTIRVTINAPGGLPIRRPALPLRQADVYKIDYPLKPGETRFDVAYSLKGQTPMSFSSKILETDGPTRLVAPAGLSIEGPGIEPLGQEPTTQATIYDVKTKEYAIEIKGSGSLRQEAATDPEEDAGMPQIKEMQPRVYAMKYAILGLAFLILGLGGWLLTRAGEREKAAPLR